MNTKIEKRACGEVRAAKDNEGTPIIKGGVLFNRITKIGPQKYEVIRPGAFKRTIDHGADIRALFNHDPNMVWARTKSGTLTVREDDAGMKYRGSVNPKDSSAMDMHAKMDRGDIDHSSFAFSVPSEQGERFVQYEDGVLRELLEVRLHDVSPVTYPAYKDSESMASVAFRNAPPLDSNNDAEGHEPTEAAKDPAQASHSDGADTVTPEPSTNQRDSELSADDWLLHTQLGHRLDFEEKIR